MMKKGTFSLTGNEWLVMEELWKGPATLMELVHALEKDPGWAKSTTATMVRRMEEKGIIRHEDGGKAKRFYPGISREEAGAAETRTLLDKAFDGSVGLMVNTLVRQEQLSREEIDTLYDILRQAEEGQT
jgi:predicted transcriptional regulator